MSANQAIPEAAVEAAAKGIWEARPMERVYEEDSPDYGSAKPWADIKKYQRDRCMTLARAALEAAAPNMLISVSTLDELVTMEPGTVLQGPDFNEETYKCTAPGTFHAIAAPMEYRASELVGRGPFSIIYRSKP